MGRSTRTVAAATHGDRCACVTDCSLNFSAVTNDAGVAEDAFDVGLREGSDPVRAETRESCAQCIALGEYRSPGEPGLESLEHEALEDACFVVYGQSPFGVVVLAHE